MRQLALELAPPPEPTAENFFPGRNGAALSALAEALGGGERFVYLWGAPGSGKTHLLRAFSARAAESGLATAYVHGSHWDAIEGLAALAIDDVQALDAAAQLRLFDLCNGLRERKAALAAAADRPPADLPLREDLRSRLASGLVLHLQVLSDEEKERALKAHAARRGIALGEDVAGYLLMRVARDMGTLIAALDALDRLSLELKRPITLALARDAIHEPTPDYRGVSK